MAQCVGHFVAQQGEHALDTGLPAGGQSPQNGAADQDCGGPQRPGLDHIGAAADTAVHQHHSPAADRVNRPGKHLGGSRIAVELAPTMVGDDHPGSPRVQCGTRIVGMGDPLRHHGQPAQAGQPLDVPPGQRLVELRAESP